MINPNNWSGSNSSTRPFSYLIYSTFNYSLYFIAFIIRLTESISKPPLLLYLQFILFYFQFVLLVLIRKIGEYQFPVDSIFSPLSTVVRLLITRKVIFDWLRQLRVTFLYPLKVRWFFEFLKERQTFLCRPRHKPIQGYDPLH